MLRFHTPGIPKSSKSHNILAGLDRIKEMGLDGIEVEFTHGVRMGSELASKVKKKLIELELTATVHGPFWINLNSKEKEKIEASKKRVLNTAIKAHELGATSITFHAAFMHEQDSKLVKSVVKDGLLEVLEELDRLEIHEVSIAPELTGKETQFGSLEQLINLILDLNKQIALCIDFSHFYARTGGKENGRESFVRTLNSIKTELGISFLDSLHMHTGGILYGPKGEKKHRPLDEEDEFTWPTLFKVLKEFNVSGWITIETPDVERSTKIAKDYYQALE